MQSISTGLPSSLLGETVTGLDQDYVRAAYGQDVYIDVGRNAEVSESDSSLDQITIYISNSQDPLNPYEHIGVGSRDGRIELSDQLNPGSTITVDGVMIGTVTRTSDQWATTIKFNDNVTAGLAQELLRSLTYTNTAEDYGISLSNIEVRIRDKSGHIEQCFVEIITAPEDKKIFSPGADAFQGSDGDDAFYALGTGLGFEDELDGGKGDDTLYLSGSSSSCLLSNLAKFANIEHIEGTRYDDSISLRADQLTDLVNINGGDGQDILVLSGTEIDFTRMEISEVEEIFISEESTITFDDVDYAKLASGSGLSHQTLILTSGTLTDDERIAIHRRGIDTIVNDGKSTTHHAPEMTKLDGDHIKMAGDQTVHIDAGQDAEISSDDGILGYLTVKITNNSGEGDLLGIDTSGWISLSKGLAARSEVSVNGVVIGIIDDFYKPSFLGIVLNENATIDVVQELLHAITYTNTAGVIGTPRAIEIGLTDMGGRDAIKSTVVVDPWEWSAERVTEGQGAGTEVGTLAPKDANGNGLSYELTGDSRDLFVLEADPESGGFKVLVKEGVALDYENPAHRTFTISVTSGGNTVERMFGLLLEDVDELPSATFEALSVNEGADGGTLVGTITASDPENGSAYCTLSPESEEFFEITRETPGVYTVKVKEGIVLDYETLAHRSFTVTVDDGLDNTVEKTFNLALHNVNEAPGLIFSAAKVSEGVGSGTLVGTLAVEDVDGPSLEYKLTGTSAALFELEQKNAGRFEIRVKAGVTLDYETLAHRSITVSVFDGDNRVEETYALDLTNVDEAPTVTFAAIAVDEGSGAGTSVGRLAATDPEKKPLSYSLVGASADLFRLVAASDGKYDVVTKPGVTLDYEDPAHRTIRVAVSDGTNKVQQTYDLVMKDQIDVRTGSRSNDVLKGQSGSDVLKGLAGDDRLFGDAGNDSLWGGAGKDTLVGDAGQDVFVFDTRPNRSANVDKIRDFNLKDDSIWLDDRVFTKLGSGTLDAPVMFKADMFVNGTRAKDGEDRIVYDKRTGSLYYDEDGTGAKTQVKIATIVNKVALTHSDFFVV